MYYYRLFSFVILSCLLSCQTSMESFQSKALIKETLLPYVAASQGSILHQNVSAHWESLWAGKEIKNEEHIKSGTAAYAQINLADFLSIFINENTELSFEGLQQIEGERNAALTIYLKSGTIFISYHTLRRQKLSVVTPHITHHLVDADLRVSADHSGSESHILHGKIVSQVNKLLYLNDSFPSESKQEAFFQYLTLPYPSMENKDASSFVSVHFTREQKDSFKQEVLKLLFEGKLASQGEDQSPSGLTYSHLAMNPSSISDQMFITWVHLIREQKRQREYHLNPELHEQLASIEAEALNAVTPKENKAKINKAPTTTLPIYMLITTTLPYVPETDTRYDLNAPTAPTKRYQDDLSKVIALNTIEAPMDKTSFWTKVAFSDFKQRVQPKFSMSLENKEGLALTKPDALYEGLIELTLADGQQLRGTAIKVKPYMIHFLVSDVYDAPNYAWVSNQDKNIIEIDRLKIAKVKKLNKTGHPPVQLITSSPSWEKEMYLDYPEESIDNTLSDSTSEEEIEVMGLFDR